MARKFYTPIDLTGLELNNFKIQNLASDPSAFGAGHAYFNTTHNEIRVYSGSAWVPVGGSIEAGIYSARPAAGNAGRVYAATDTQVLYVDNGSAWVQIGDPAGAAATALQDAKDYADGLASDYDPAGSASTAEQNAKDYADGLASNYDPAGSAATAESNAKAYADALTQGLDVKASVRVATTTDITLTNTQTVDGVSLSVDDRVLVKAQTDASKNGIYLVKSGAWVRAADANADAEVTKGLFTFVEEGSLAGTGWVLSAKTDVLGTGDLTFSQFSGAGTYSAGTGITLSGTTFAIDSANGYGVRKAVFTIGDGSSTTFTLSHSLGDNIAISLFDNDTNDEVFADITAGSSNIVVSFAVAPGVDAFRLVAVG